MLIIVLKGKLRLISLTTAQQ